MFMNIMSHFLKTRRVAVLNATPGIRRLFQNDKIVIKMKIQLAWSEYKSESEKH